MKQEHWVKYLPVCGGGTKAYRVLRRSVRVGLGPRPAGVPVERGSARPPWAAGT